MAFLFKDYNLKNTKSAQFKLNEEQGYPQWVLLLFFIFLVLILVIGTANLSLSVRLGAIALLVFGVIVLLKYYFTGEDIMNWGTETWELTKKIFPILIIGTFAVGVIAYYLPPETFRPFIGGNSIISCFIASVMGALLYMPTLLEVPIVGTTFGYSAGVIGDGPALSLLLAGPAVSLPSMLALQRIMGTIKTVAFVMLVVVVSTLAGFVYGNMF
jgi:uncharacterized membrane protein YraQ (UPF0718 family)